MKIAILTQHYPPEVGAPQNRLHNLAQRMKERGIDVEVLTAMPNYPQMEIYPDYRGKLFVEQKIDGIRVFRSWLYVKRARKNLLLRLIGYLSFTLSSLITGLLKLSRVDYIFCESPPLPLGISADLLARVKKSRLIFNVSDAWPESAVQAGLLKNGLAISIATKMEKYFYRRSYLICGQTRGIVKHIEEKTGGKPVYWLRNGADLSFFRPIERSETEWRKVRGFAEDDILFLYAGIIGLFQGLETVLRAASKLKSMTKVKFVIIGEGPEKEKLLKLKSHLGLENVLFFDPQPRAAMPETIAACDVGVVPLRRLKILAGAVPSKSFEYLAMKRPILLGAEGEARELLIDEGEAGLAFEPENPDDLAEKALKLAHDPDLRKRLGDSGSAYVQSNFDRTKIADSFLDHLKDISS